MLEITSSPDISKLTTLRLGGQAIALIDVFEENDLDLLPNQLYSLGGKSYVLGGGSNILATDSNLPFVLVRTKIFHDPIVTHVDEKGRVFVRVSAAMRLSRFLAWCCEKGLSGMENLAGIPGTVGGAVAGNAGSYGRSIGECIHEVDIFFFKKGKKTLQKNEIQYSYRMFSVDEEPGQFLITAVTVVLNFRPKQKVLEVIKANIARKACIQPVQSKSAGCIFKNPDGSLSAGKLLEQAGFKGKYKDGIGFSSLHANFLINEGYGKSSIAFELVYEAQQKVKNIFDVLLQPEVKVWTC